MAIKIEVYIALTPRGGVIAKCRAQTLMMHANVNYPYWNH